LRPSKRGSLSILEGTIGKRLKDYTEKNMSAAAKEILIKVVAQAIPTYTMSIFKLPLGEWEYVMS
jgi:hypothetical protein